MDKNNKDSRLSNMKGSLCASAAVVGFGTTLVVAGVSSSATLTGMFATATFFGCALGAKKLGFSIHFPTYIAGIACGSVLSLSAAFMMTGKILPGKSLDDYSSKSERHSQSFKASICFEEKLCSKVT